MRPQPSSYSAQKHETAIVTLRTERELEGLRLVRLRARVRAILEKGSRATNETGQSSAA